MFGWEAAETYERADFKECDRAEVNILCLQDRQQLAVDEDLPGQVRRRKGGSATGKAGGGEDSGRGSVGRREVGSEPGGLG